MTGFKEIQPGGALPNRQHLLKERETVEKEGGRGRNHKQNKTDNGGEGDQ